MGNASAETKPAVATGDRVERFIEAVHWQFAKTMPEWPHWYVLKRWNPELEADFTEFVRRIFEEGRDEPWGEGSWRRITRYYYSGEYKYWVMEDAIEEAFLINRARVDGKGSEDVKPAAQCAGRVEEATMAASQATTGWRDEPVTPTLADYEDVGALVALARKARGRIVELDWTLTEQELRRLRKDAYEWGSEVTGRYRLFNARLLAAINEVLDERDTQFVLSEPKNAAGTDCSVSSTRVGAGFRLHGHAPFDVVIGYGVAAVEDDPDETVQAGDSVWTTLEGAIELLGWDLTRLVRPELRAAQNALYGLPLEYGVEEAPEQGDAPAEEIRVRFTGPYMATEGGPSPCLLTSDVSQEGGVYIWTIEVNGEHRPWYVGQTRRGFGQRMGEHLRSYLCGEYNVYDPEALARGENRVLWRPSAADATWPETLPEFLRQATSLTPKLLEVVRLLRFHVAPLKDDKKIRDRVEGALGRHFKRLPGEFFDVGIRLPARIPGGRRLRLQLASEAPIVGLPSEISE